MKEINYWEQFMATGRIEDFLAYKNAARQEEPSVNKEDKRGQEHSHAGDYGDYRDSVKG